MENNDELMPREKLLAFGAKALSDYELLAIFLRTGIKDCPVMSLSKNVLTHFGSLHALLSADKKAFCSVKVRYYAIYSTASDYGNDQALFKARDVKYADY